MPDDVKFMSQAADTPVIVTGLDHVVLRVASLERSVAFYGTVLGCPIERELETGAMVTRGAGYLHPACVGAWAEKASSDLHELVEGVKANSRLVEADLAATIDAIDPTS